MPLPISLQQVISQAHLQMLNHPQHALTPFHRHRIYRVLNAVDETIDQYKYKYLAGITAQFVLPIWQQVWPTDEMPHSLLHTAERLLNATIDVAQATPIAEDAWQKLERLGYDPSRFAIRCALHSGHAALEALFAALGRPPFDHAEPTEHDTDADLDPWTSDTALWAATAYAGGVWETESDSGKRQEFWSWWLQEAIPTAWRLEN